MGDAKNSAHTTWNCNDHRIIAPVYRRRMFYGEKRQTFGGILRKCCEWRGVNMVKCIAALTYSRCCLRFPLK